MKLWAALRRDAQDAGWDSVLYGVVVIALSIAVVIWLAVRALALLF